MINAHCGLEGIITLKKGADPDKMEVVSEFPNMILDRGLPRMGKYAASTNLNWCNLGVNNEAVTASQTTLLGRIKFSNTSGPGNGESGANNEDPDNRYVFYRSVRRFAPTNTDSYNVAEVGFGWNNQGSLFNRALVTDANGIPTTISVLENEYLDVVYELRMYPPAHTMSGSFTPTGDIDVAPRTWIARALGSNGNVTYSANATIGFSPGDIITASGYSYLTAYTKNINQVFFGTPTGGSAGNTSSSSYATSSSLGLDSSDASSGKVMYKILLDGGNHASGIRSMVFYTNGTAYAVEFSEPFMKTNTDEITFTVHHSWGRR